MIVLQKQDSERIACLTIFFIGFIVVFGLVSTTPIISNHWITMAYVVSAPLSFFEALFPLILTYPTFLFLHRPLAVMVYGFLYNTVGLNPVMFHFLQGIFAGYFGTVSYLLLRKLGSEKKTAYIASVLGMLSLPVIVSSWFIADTDVIGAAFAFTAFLFYKKIGKNISGKNLTVWALMFLFSAGAIIAKEIPRLLLLVLLFSDLGLKFLNRKKLEKHKVACFLVVSAAAVLFTSTMFGIDFPDWYKTVFTFNSLFFKTMHNFSQLMYPIFISGVSVLFSSLLFQRRPVRRTAVIGILVFLAVLGTPLLVEFSFFGMAFFSEPIPVYIFSTLLVGVLVFIFLKERDLEQFGALVPLILLITVITLTAGFTFSRDDIACRIYIGAVPFLFYFTIKYFRRAWKLLKNRKEFVYRVFLVTLILSLIMMLYHIPAGIINSSMEMNARYSLEKLTRERLTGQDLEGNVVLFTDVINPLGHQDLEAFGVENPERVKFVFLDPEKEFGTLDDMMEEICIDTALSSPRPRYAYVHLVRYRPEVDSSLYRILQGNFGWLETSETFRMMHPTELQASFWAAEYGMARLHQKKTYTDQVLLEKFLEKRAEPLYVENRTFFQISGWTEDFLSRTFLGIPHLIGFECLGKVYRIDTRELECSNWFKQEMFNKTRFRWVHQNATLMVDNPGNASRVRLKAIMSSFYRPRMLRLYFNGKLAGTYNVTNIWLNQEITTPVLELEPGKNTFVFNSPDGCEVPLEAGAWEYDQRCLTFAFEDVEILNRTEIREKVFFGSGWYSEEMHNNTVFRWMGESGSVSLYSEEEKPVKLSFVAWSYRKPRILDIYLNREPVASYNLTGWANHNILTPVMELEKGENLLEIRPREGCDVPSEGNDTRCLSFGISYLRFLNTTQLSDYLFYGSGWFGTEYSNQTAFNWAGKSAELTFFNSANYSRNITVNFYANSFRIPRELRVLLNGEKIRTYNLTEKWFGSRVFLPLRNLEPGDNRIELEVDGCDIPEEYGIREDQRCLGFAISGLSTENPDIS